MNSGGGTKFVFIFITRYDYVMASTLTMTINPSRKRHKVSIELDADRFERLAAHLGLFRKEFLESLERAERDIAQGKVRRLGSLKDLARHD